MNSTRPDLAVPSSTQRVLPRALAGALACLAATAVAAQSAPAPAARVAIDPVTKQIRPLEPDEARALDRDAQARVRAASSNATANRQFRGPGGSVGMTLDDSTHSHVVARRAADGKVSTQCDTVPGKVAQSAAAPAAAPISTAARGGDDK